MYKCQEVLSAWLNMQKTHRSHHGQCSEPPPSPSQALLKSIPACVHWILPCMEHRELQGITGGGEPPAACPDLSKSGLLWSSTQFCMFSLSDVLWGEAKNKSQGHFLLGADSMAWSGVHCPRSISTNFGEMPTPSLSPWSRRWRPLTNAGHGVLVGLWEEVWEGEDEGTRS